MNVFDMASETLQKAIKAVVDGIKTTTDTTKTSVESLNNKQDTLMQKVQSGDLKRKVAIFTTPGTHYWTCPEDVDTVILTMFGGGGSGATYPNTLGSGATVFGGSGGAYVAGKPIKVTPGTTYSIVVGAGGPGAPIGSTWSAGNAGGATSAFGILCNGGRGGLVGANTSLKDRAIGNHPFCSIGTLSLRLDESIQYSNDFLTRTNYGVGGGMYQSPGTSILYLGGGAGFGDGGEGGDIFSQKNPIGYGSGSGASYANSGTRDGGNGIVIIEY